jgi:hypothetical protein
MEGSFVKGVCAMKIMVSVLLLCCILFASGCGEVQGIWDHRQGYAAGQKKVQHSRQRIFGELGLCFQRDFTGIRGCDDKSQDWNDGYKDGIRDELAKQP